MSTAGKLSSYFTKRKGHTGASTSTEEVSSPSSSVRARLEKKLQVRQKTGFAFNFAIDSGTDNLQEIGGGQGVGERGSFRFGFNPADGEDVGTSAAESSGRGSVGDISLRAAQDFIVEVEDGSRAQPNGKQKSKRKGAGKKKGGKGKSKPREQSSQDLAGEQEPQQDLATDFPTTARSPTVGDGEGETRSSTSLPLAAACDSSPIHEYVQHNNRSNKAPGLRPPPGFTLESWKDPAISSEERRRRRFGNGVRNLAAIQRSSDARRGFLADGELGAEKAPGRPEEALAKPGRDTRLGVGMVDTVASGGTTSGGGRASSVFSFGFDIGISFDGGS